MIRRRREEEYQRKSGHERWVVSYADFITLLFAFFVVMYSVSQVNEQKYRVLSETLGNIFQGADEKTDGSNSHSGSGVGPTLVDTNVLAQELEDALAEFVRPGNVRIAATEEWVQIDLNANLLFDSASAEPKPDAQEIFREIAGKLAPFENEIEVSGHTDNVPIRTVKYHSNWELSSARASSVVRLLADNGVNPAQLSAVGYGEYRPVADNGTEEGRAANRRVVLMIARHAVERSVMPFSEFESSQEEVAPPQISGSPATTPAPSEITQSAAPDEITADTSQKEPGIQPVRLNHGGLLFTSDPSKKDDNRLQ